MMPLTRNLIAVWVLCLGLALPSCLGGEQGTLEEGIAAYQGGDYVTAWKVLRPLALRGDAEAQLKVGEMYFFGRSVAKDYPKAKFWFVRAAGQGLAEAAHKLGIMYANGYGIRKDDAKAFSWYHLAAEQGHPKAQSDLGSAYASGQGVPQNIVLAYMWFSLSAEQGNQPAAEGRALAAKEMTPAQIAEAQKLAREWKPKK
jgi:TPR repeat protein